MKFSEHFAAVEANKCLHFLSMCAILLSQRHDEDKDKCPSYGFSSKRQKRPGFAPPVFSFTCNGETVALRLLRILPTQARRPPAPRNGDDAGRGDARPPTPEASRPGLRCGPARSVSFLRRAFGTAW